MVEYKRTYVLREDNPVAAAIAAVEAPQAVFFDLGRKCPVAKHSTGTTLFRYDDIVELTRRTDILGFGAPGPSMGSPRPNIPIDLDGSEHRSFRMALNPLLSARAVARLEPEIRRLANGLIDAFAGRERVELYSELCAPLPAAVFSHLCGLPIGDFDFIYGLQEKVLRPRQFSSSDAEASELVARTAAQAMAYLDEKVTARRRLPPGEDLMSQLIQLQVDGRAVTQEQVLDMLWLFVLGALDTVTSSLATIFAWLADHPAERQRVVAQPRIIPAAIEELMRYQTPVAQGARYAMEDMEIGGVKIAAGEQIMCTWAAANLDPEVFPDPLRVDFDRGAKGHVAFATGFHHCIGAHLARLEMRCVLEEFHRRIPSYSLVEDDPPQWVFESARCPMHLPLKLTWAAPAAIS